MSYSIGLLPLPGTQAIGDTVAARRAVMRATLRVIDGIRTGPHGLSADLRLRLDNLRFHVGAALAFIDTFMRSGGAPSDLAAEVPNMENSIALYLNELRPTKIAWNNWIDTAWKDTINADLGADTAPPVDKATVLAPVDEQNVEITPDDLKPPPISQNMLFLGGAVVVAGLIWLVGRK